MTFPILQRASLKTIAFRSKLLRQTILGTRGSGVSRTAYRARFQRREQWKETHFRLKSPDGHRWVELHRQRALCVVVQIFDVHIDPEGAGKTIYLIIYFNKPYQTQVVHKMLVQTFHGF